MLTLHNENILKEIEKVAENEDSGYIDAILDYAHKHDIEVETLGDLIRKIPSFSSRVQDGAEDRKLLEKTSKLPI